MVYAYILENVLRAYKVDNQPIFKLIRECDLPETSIFMDKMGDSLRPELQELQSIVADGDTVLVRSLLDLAEKSDKVYSGPSVLSYTLDGRKASKLPIPAYRCYAGGEVTVIIVVNPQGMVIGAEVKDDISSTDQCLRNFAVRAARLSKFSQSSTAPARQTGEIVYRFIAQ